MTKYPISARTNTAGIWPSLQHPVCRSSEFPVYFNAPILVQAKYEISSLVYLPAVSKINMAIAAALTILLLTALGLAAGPKTPCEVCFTSFFNCKSNGGVCTFDHDTYPVHDPAGGVETIFVGFDYTIAWKGADPSFPLRISWQFSNDTNTQSDNIRWAHEIRAPSQSGTWVWNARDVLKDFPTPYAPNMTGLEALAHASTDVEGWFGISQPEKSNAEDLSDPFVLLSQVAERTISAQYRRGRREVEEKWRLGVGIGVGLGVPLLLALFWVIGYRQGKKGSWNWRTHVPKPE